MNNNFIEVKRYFRDNRSLIVFGSVLFSIIFVFGSFLYSSSRTEILTRTQTEAQKIKESISPVGFQVYIENEDESLFTNNNIINQYFSLNSTRNEIKEATGIDLDTIEKKYTELGIADDVKMVHAYRDDSNGLIVISVNVGNEIDNLKLSKHVYELLEDKEIVFLKDKSMYFFKKPAFIGTKKNASDLANNANLSKKEQSTILSFVKNILIGLIVGIFISFGVSILKNLLSDKINYFFGIYLDEDDSFYLYSPIIKNESQVAKFVAFPYKSQKIILTEKPLEQEVKNLFLIDKDISFTNKTETNTLLVEKQTLVDIDSSIEFSEIIILIQTYETSKKWYKTQKKLSEIYGKPVKFIQVNK